MSLTEPSGILGEEIIIDRSFRLGNPLGQGGMGTVYRATQLVSGTAVALKLVSQAEGILHPRSLSQDLNYRLALTREFQTLASLHHPNIIRVLSYGFDEKAGSYYTMELLEEPQTILEAAQAKTDVDKVELLAQLLRALVYVHQRKILHRDIKPSNVALGFSRRKGGYVDGLRTSCGWLDSGSTTGVNAFRF